MMASDAPACRYCRHWVADEAHKPVKQGYCMAPDARPEQVKGGWHWQSDEAGLVTGPATWCERFVQTQPEDI
jgi:hypothetical protein